MEFKVRREDLDEFIYGHPFSSFRRLEAPGSQYHQAKMGQVVFVDGRPTRHPLTL